VTKTCAILAILFAAACADSNADDDDVSADANPSAPDAPAGARTEVVLETTLGTMVVRLEDQEMPITTANFLTYVDSGFYDDTLIHRVVDDWVIQGGGFSSGLVPKSTNPAIPLETSPNVSHVHGAISMARTSDPNSATSQWFIVDWPTSGTPPQPAQLDGQYAAFGGLIEGLDDVPLTEIVVTSAHRR